MNETLLFPLIYIRVSIRYPLRRMSAFAETVRTLPGFVPVDRFGGARARVQHVRLFNEANEKAVS